MLFENMVISVFNSWQLTVEIKASIQQADTKNLAASVLVDSVFITELSRQLWHAF